ncbi:Uncharacterized protein ChrSV_3494 [Chromobacterium vaccinii]|nr:Uncharacterized protein ChrSW_3494 [Chromobacterium vaccinii]QND90951.1 Uncharacterized protein ChrSV_3494 [Chromobacterium vaccinii]
MFNKLLALLLVLPPFASAETIDTFAKSSLARMAAPAAAMPSAGAMPPLPMPGAAVPAAPLPGRSGAAQTFDVMFIQGNGAVRKAYLLVDGKYGKMVREGDKLLTWKVLAVGDDYVDVARGGRRTRLLMDAGTATSERR